MSGKFCNKYICSLTIRYPIFLASLTMPPQAELSKRFTNGNGKRSITKQHHDKLMRYYIVCPFFLSLKFRFYLFNKLPIMAGIGPLLIPLSGSACTALSDTDANQNAAR